MIKQHYLWKLRPYYRHVAGLLFVGMLSGTIMNIAVVLPAILLGRAIDTALALEQGTASYRSLIIAAIAYVGGCCLNLTAQVGKRWWLRTANYRTVSNIRSDALRGILAWPMKRLHGTAVGDTMARIVGDAQVVLVSFNEATTELLDTWLFSISLVVAMMVYDVRLALLAICPVPLAFVLAYLSGSWIRARTAKLRRANANVTVALQEFLSGVRILRLFGRSKAAVDRVASLSEDLRQSGLSEIRLRLGLQPIYSFLVTAGVLMVVWIGGQKVLTGVITTGTLVAFLQLYIRFITRGHRIPLFFNRIQAGGVAYRRLEPMLAPPPDRISEPRFASWMPGRITGIDDPVPSPPVCGVESLEVRSTGLRFRYPGSDHMALDDITFHVDKGEILGITGPIGAGKTALVQILVGLYPPDSGSASMGGRHIQEWQPDERAARVAYLPQEPGLFSGTVRENIGLGDTHGEFESDVLFRSGLEPDIAVFPEGLDTRIGEGGIRVSGGQRQRIALARALASGNERPPGLLLLDDPFSAIDVDTEVQIYRSLLEAYGSNRPSDQQATMIICSHRLAMFPQTDRIIVLDSGRIVEKGTHEQLMEACGLYSRIFHAQHVVHDLTEGDPRV